MLKKKTRKTGGRLPSRRLPTAWCGGTCDRLAGTVALADGASAASASAPERASAVMCQVAATGR
jgi:hypothetical protein